MALRAQFRFLGPGCRGQTGCTSVRSMTKAEQLLVAREIEETENKQKYESPLCPCVRVCVLLQCAADHRCATLPVNVKGTI